MNKRKDTARCHCGRIRFSFISEEIKDAVRCNCSMCIRKGAVMSTKYIPHEDFRPIVNPEQLTAYQWNDRVMDHTFCKVCGIYPYHGDPEQGYRVNLGCVEQLDAYALEIKILDGKSMTIAQNPGPHPGETHS